MTHSHQERIYSANLLPNPTPISRGLKQAFLLAKVFGNEDIRYELTPKIAKVIVMAIDEIDLAKCRAISNR